MLRKRNWIVRIACTMNVVAKDANIVTIFLRRKGFKVCGYCDVVVRCETLLDFERRLLCQM